MSSIPLGATEPLVPPLYQSSVYTIPDLDVLDQIYNAEETGFIYARDSHPNAVGLASTLTRLHSGAWSIICGSGMAAINACLLPMLRQGDRIIASNKLYGRTNQLFRQEFGRFGVGVTFVDTGSLDEVRQALQSPARALFVETMSNPMCRVMDLPALADMCKVREVRLIVDNTFATPVLCKPLSLGADLVMESLTKMMGGHGDITLGSVTGVDMEMLPTITQTVSIWGLASNPFDCWLAERGLATLDLRMKTASENAAGLAQWLVEQQGVWRVIYPGREDHPDHALAGRLFGNRFGNMLCFELAGGRDAVNRFMRQASAIAFSPSLGSTRTTCSHPSTTSHRYESPAEKRRQGITDGLIRLSVGIEDIQWIKAEMAKGL